MRRRAAVLVLLGAAAVLTVAIAAIRAPARPDDMPAWTEDASLGCLPRLLGPSTPCPPASPAFEGHHD